MAEHIGIELEVIGLQEYKQKLQEAQRYTKSLSGKKLKIDLSANSQSLKRQLQEVRNQLGEYKKEIKILQGYKDLNFEVKIRNAEEIANVRQRIRELKAELKELQLSDDYEGRSNAIAGKKSSILEREKQLNQLLAEKNRIDEELDDIDIKIKKIDVNRKDLEATKEEINNALRIEPAINYKAVFKAGKSIQGAIGTSLETIGNGLTSISHNVITETITGIFRQLGYGITNLATEGLQGSIARYDILKTYPQTMEAVGFSSEQAESSIDRLNKSVLGLPTSLSEIVDVAKRYTTALGDIDKGTDLAIAANNAFLASSAEESQKYQGMLQIADLVAGKQLNAREWNSLNASMSTAMRYIGEQLGYTSHQEFLQALTSNQISNEEFLNALIESGTEGKIADLTQIAKSKLGSAIANIKNAFARGGANVLEGLDEALKLATGKDIVENVADITKVIDDSAGKIVTWMKENPQVIKEWVDRLKSIDIIGFLEGTARGLRDTFAIFTSLLKMLPGGMSGAGHFLVMAGAYGRIITTIGQFVKGFSPVGGVINVFAKWRKSGQPVFEGMGNFFKGAKKASKAEGVADAATTATNIEKAGKSAFNIVGALKSVAAAVGIFVTVGAGIAAVSGEILLTVKAIKAISDESEGIDWSRALKVFGSIAGIIAIIGSAAMIGGHVISTAALASVLEAMAVAEVLIAGLGVIATTIVGFMAIDTWLIKQSAENIGETLTAVKFISEIAGTIHFDANKVADVSALMTAVSDIADNVSFWDSVDDKWTSGNLRKTTDNLKDAISGVSEVSALLVDIKRPSQASMTVVKDIVEMVGDVYKYIADSDAFDIGIQDKGAVNKKESKNISTILSNFADAVQTISQIATTMDELTETLEGLNGSYSDDGATKLEWLKERYKSVLNSIGEIFTYFREENKQWFYKDGKSTSGEKDSAAISEILGNFQSAVNTIGLIAGSMNELTETLNELNTDYSENGSATKLDWLSEQYDAVLKAISGIFEQFRETNKQWFYKDGKNSTYGETMTGGIAEMIGNISDAIEAIKSVVEYMGSIEAELSDLSSRRRGGLSGIEQISLNMESMINSLNGLFTNLNENFSVDMDEIGPKMTQLSSAVGQISSAAASLMEASGPLEELGVGAEGSFDIADRISNLIVQLGGALEGIGGEGEGLAAKAMAFSGSIQQIMNGVNALIGTDTTGLVGIETQLANIWESLDTLKDKLETFFTEESSRFKSAGEEWHDALIDGFNSVDLSTTISTALNSMFSVQSFYTNGYLTGSSYANGLAAGLRSVTIANSSVRGIMASLGLANGGEVQYRAGGGTIFRPRGTDTVPAMLTPGEWVMRKHTVDTLGKGFMDRINNLDIPGALYSLSTKAGAKLASLSPKIINNTTNNTNNASVTQNIFGGSQGYSLRRADRYVRAL